MIVWDFPLRLFHWSLFICVVGAIISAKIEVLWVHERFGLAVLGLVIFRIFLGVSWRSLCTVQPVSAIAKGGVERIENAVSA
jgi:cytochrome b